MIDFIKKNKLDDWLESRYLICINLDAFDQLRSNESNKLKSLDAFVKVTSFMLNHLKNVVLANKTSRVKILTELLLAICQLELFFGIEKEFIEQSEKLVSTRIDR